MNTEMDTKHELLLSRVGDGEAALIVMSVLSTARWIDDACARLLSQYGLSEGRFALLLAVDERESVSPAWAADRIGVTRATVTGLLDGLAKSGLVVRGVDPADRRSQSVTLTKAGSALVEELVPQYRDWLGQIADGIKAQTALLEGLDRLRENLQPHPQGGASS